MFFDAPLVPTLSNFGLKRCFLVSYSPNPSCVPNLKLPASTVAEISRDPEHLLDAPLAPTPTNFGPKCCFLVRYSPNPACVPNFKLLASMAAEKKYGVPNFLGRFPSPAPC